MIEGLLYIGGWQNFVRLLKYERKGDMTDLKYCVECNRAMTKLEFDLLRDQAAPCPSCNLTPVWNSYSVGSWTHSNLMDRVVVQSNIKHPIPPPIKEIRSL